MDRLRALDAQSSVLDEFAVRTVHGAALSLITILGIIYLTYLEYAFNLTPVVVDRVHVNATSPDGLEVEFDITFPKIPCALLSVDAADPTGQAQSLHISKEHRVWKHRLDPNGNEIGQRSRFELGSTMRDETHLRDLVLREKAYLLDPNITQEEQEDECGSCYGAESEGECCNTCDDVKRVYRRKGWLIPELDKIKQCRNMPKSEEEKNEGCNIHGIVALSSGGGNFHVAPGHALEFFGNEQKLTFNDVLMGAFETFNCSHVIKKLRFGVDFPGNVYQLDGQNRTVNEEYVMHQYYIQIVPTLYKYLNGTSIQTNQFSVTEHTRLVNPGTGRGLPGVFFFYEISPLHVEFIEKRLGWIRFLTSVCAVVGGVFTVMGVIDKWIYDKSKISKRNNLG